MPRGSAAASRANLAGAAGGDRYAGKRATIAAIRNALETGLTEQECREFFGLRDSQLVKAKHRARMAKVRAPKVYKAMVESMADAVATPPGLRVAGFVDRMAATSGRGRLYPVAIGGGPLAEYELQHRRVEFVPDVGNYDGVPFSGEIEHNGFYSLDYWQDGPGETPQTWWVVPVKSQATATVIFDDGTVQSWVVTTAPAGILVWGHAVGEQYMPPGGAIPVWRARLIIDHPDKDLEEGFIFRSPAGWYLTPAEWRRRRRPVMVDWRAWEWIGQDGLPGSSGYPMPVENWAENFPQVRAAVDSVRLGVQNRAGVEWITGVEWMTRYGGGRASYLSAGCAVPPVSSPPVVPRVAVTFDAEFLAEIAAAYAGPPSPVPQA